MSDDSEIIVEILKEIFGEEKHHYESKGQIAFDCPICDEERHKGNLEINYFQNVFKCWSCGDFNNMKGPLGKLIDDYGTKKHKKLYKVLKPEEEKVEKVRKPKLKLPEGFTLFKDSNPIYPIYRQAYNYLKNRGITDDIIEKYNIGFCDKGSHSGRIVVPSFDNKRDLNYYIARSWDPKSRAKYKNPEAEKDKIIFNENLINWDKDIYLVEGAFDSFFLDNPLVMLGKKMSKLILETLYNKANANIIICVDGDAWDDGLRMYHELNGGRLYNKVKIIKLPKDKDVCDLRGDIKDYYYEIK